MNDALKQTLDALDGVRECGNGWEALCPAHDDTNASLSVAEGNRANVVVNCHAGCAQEAVLEALRGRMNGHTPASLRSRKKKAASRKPKKAKWSPWQDGRQAAVYEYTDAEGAALFEVVRFEVKKDHPAYPDKTFIQRVPGKGWGRKKHGVEPVLYRLPAVREAARAGRVVFVVEGEKDVHTLEEAGFKATTCPQGAEEWKDRYAGDLEGARVFVIPDNDEQGEGHAEDVAASCYGRAASVRVLDPMPGVGPKGDVTDWFEAGGDAEGLKQLAREASEYEPPQATQKVSRDPVESAAADAAEKDDRTQSEVLLDGAADWKLFHTPKGDKYATFTAGGVRQTAKIGSNTATDALRHTFYSERGKSPSAQALTDANDTLRAKANFDGEKKAVHLRVAGHEGAIYIDLCNDAWEVVKITAEGWEVVGDPPVKFRRVQGMKALPKPKKGGTLNLLRNHVRLSDDAFTLLLGYLVQSVRPVGPYPILELTGEQGSGKSTAAKMIRALVDPSHIPIRTRPRKERDLVIAAENAWAPAFDNMSGVQPWLSDAFCRLSTGGGFGTRKLYADREEEIFYARRPVILNGINELAGRSDLADRAIRLELEAIPEAERRTEADVWKRFERDRPRIIGALFDAVATALRREPSVELDRLPRMADFARWAVAAEPAFSQGEDGSNPNGSAFLNAYQENRAEASESAVEGDTVASAIRALLNDGERERPGEWEGKTTELMEDLTPYLPDPEKPPKDYPASYQAMGKRLRRIMPTLRDVGIEREENQGPKGRRFRFQIAGGKEVEEAEVAEPKRRKRSGSGAKKRPSHGIGGNSSATPLPPQRDGRQSKGTATHDGKPVTVVHTRENGTAVVENAKGEQFNASTDELDFPDAPF